MFDRNRIALRSSSSFRVLACAELRFLGLGDIGNRSSWLGFMLTRFPSWLKTHPPLHNALSNNAI